MPRATPEPRHPSYWMLTSEGASFPPFRGEASTDVVVLGAGITGLTTALFLKRAGFRVVVLEAREVGGGITGNTTAKLTALHGLTYARLSDSEGAETARIYAAANLWAIGMISELVEELDIDCQFERRPVLTYTTDSEKSEDIEREVDAALNAGLSAELVRESDLPFPIAAGIQLPDQASFHPLRYVLALAMAVDGDGSYVYEQTRAVDVEENGEPITVQLEGGARVHASHVVSACGLPFLDRGGFFATAYPSRSYCVALESDGALPESMSINAERPTLSVRPITAPGGGKLLLVAGHDHKVGQAEHTSDHYAFLEDFAHRCFPVGAVAARWSSQDYIPVDGLPMVGRMPFSSDRLYVATGFKKWGLTTGTIAGRILTDLIEGRENSWASIFDARRTKVLDGAGEALKEQANVAKRFVGDRIRQAAAGSPDELPPGAGAICKTDGEVVAAYREETGELHLLSPTCTHMGCRVTWNEAERSWDCPCHGSRFDVTGEILVGPAVAPLERR